MVPGSTSFPRWRARGAEFHRRRFHTTRGATPRANKKSKGVRSRLNRTAGPYERWMYTNFIELVVDGNVVDLNRIPLPPDTPIIDLRFVQQKAAAGNAARAADPAKAKPATGRAS